MKEEAEQQLVKVEELKREIEIIKSEEGQLKKQLDDALGQVLPLLYFTVLIHAAVQM